MAGVVSHIQILTQVRYDMRGHGRSGKPDVSEGYASNLYAADYAAVAEEFQLFRPVFVGW